MSSTDPINTAGARGAQPDYVTSRIVEIAKSLPRQPWGIGSRQGDLVEFGYALLKSPEIHTLVAANAQASQAVPTADRLILDRLLEAARRHGADSEPDHEVGDLQDLLRAAWEQFTSDQRRNFLMQSAVSNVLEGAILERLVTGGEEIDTDEWDKTVKFFGLDSSFQYNPMDVADYVNRYRLATYVPLGVDGRYVHGSWGHYFETGQPERLIRFAFDRTTNQLAALEVQNGGTRRWNAATSGQWAHVLDSLTHGNEHAMNSPADYGLDADDELPLWAQVSRAHDSACQVLLADRGNPDYGQDPNAPVSGKADAWVPVESLMHASKTCREYIDSNNLGGGNWTGGQVKDSAGNVVARVSYNGRIWSPDGRWDLLQLAEAQAPAVARERGG